MACCYLCSGAAVTGCPRCGRPLCLEHALDPERRCVECELEYARRQQTHPLLSVVLVLLLATALAGAWAFGRYLDAQGYLIVGGGDTPWAQFAVYASLFLAVFGLAGAVQGARQRLLRHRFLTEGRHGEPRSAG